MNYILEVSPKSGKRYNPLHNKCNGCTAGILSADVGQSAWFWYYDDVEDIKHRVKTSRIKKKTEQDKAIIIETENTYYTFIPKK